MGDRFTKLETKLKNDIECFSGGTDKFSNVFDNIEVKISGKYYK